MLARAAATVMMLASPVLVPMLILYATGGTIGSPGNEWGFGWKPVWFALSLNGYDVSLSAGSMAALLVLLGYLAVTRRLEFSGTGKWIAAGFVIAFIAIPFKLIGVRMTDIRMIPAALVILPAFLSFRPAKPPGSVAGIVVCALIVMNAGYAAYVWLSYRSDYAEMKASFALLQPYSFVLVGDSRTGEVPSTLLTDAPMSRAPTLAVHYARAFVSSLYTIAGAEPVEVRPDLAHLDVSMATETYHSAVASHATGARQWGQCRGSALPAPLDAGFSVRVPRRGATRKTRFPASSTSSRGTEDLRSTLCEDDVAASPRQPLSSGHSSQSSRFRAATIPLDILRPAVAAASRHIAHHEFPFRVPSARNSGHFIDGRLPLDVNHWLKCVT